jgi:glycine/D-amino acid oxidase-like deaminating enzyme
MRVLICGGGVIGASIAYFLSCRGVEVTVIERVGVASAASGKAGGFLALDWCDGTPLEPLVRRHCTPGSPRKSLEIGAIDASRLMAAASAHGGAAMFTGSIGCLRP